MARCAVPVLIEFLIRKCNLILMTTETSEAHPSAYHTHSDIGKVFQRRRRRLFGKSEPRTTKRDATTLGIFANGFRVFCCDVPLSVCSTFIYTVCGHVDVVSEECVRGFCGVHCDCRTAGQLVSWNAGEIRWGRCSKWYRSHAFFVRIRVNSVIFVIDLQCAHANICLLLQGIQNMIYITIA